MSRFLWMLALIAAPLIGCGGDDSPGGAGGMGATGGGSAGAGGASECANDDECDDGDPCTSDVCGEGGRCEYPPADDGTVCPDGICVVGACEPVQSVFPCTEQGVVDAIALGGGPYGFSCDGPQTVSTTAELILEADVILDGLGRMTVDGGDQHRLITIPTGVTAELRRLTLTGGFATEGNGGALVNSGTLTIAESTVSGNAASNSGGGLANFGGLANSGAMTIERSTVSGNNSAGDGGGGVFNSGVLTIVESTVSGNTAAAGGDGGGLRNTGTPVTLASSTISGNDALGDGGGIANGNVGLTLLNSTVSGNDAVGTGGGIWNMSGMAIVSCTIAANTAADADGIGNSGVVMMMSNTLVDGECSGNAIGSDGYSIESPGDTCGFDQPTDLVDVSAGALALGLLADNGGSTQTHALATASIAVNAIPAATCEVEEDQRGVARPQGAMCDIGAFELEP